MYGISDIGNGDGNNSVIFGKWTRPKGRIGFVVEDGKFKEKYAQLARLFQENSHDIISDYDSKLMKIAGVPEERLEITENEKQKAVELFDMIKEHFAPILNSLNHRLKGFKSTYTKTKAGLFLKEFEDISYHVNIDTDFCDPLCKYQNGGEISLYVNANFTFNTDGDYHTDPFYREGIDSEYGYRLHELVLEALLSGKSVEETKESCDNLWSRFGIDLFDGQFNLGVNPLQGIEKINDLLQDYHVFSHGVVDLLGTDSYDIPLEHENALFPETEFTFRDDYEALKKSAITYLEEKIQHLRTDHALRLGNVLYRAENCQLRTQ
jgi:hypothetical protein